MKIYFGDLYRQDGTISLKSVIKCDTCGKFVKFCDCISCERNVGLGVYEHTCRRCAGRPTVRELLNAQE